MNGIKLACGALTAGVMMVSAASASPGSGAIRASDVWSRPTPAGLPTGVAYLTLRNSGAADRLVGASTPVAAQATLHRSSLAHGVMSMAPVPGGLAVPAHGEVSLAPNGYHLMLTGLKRGLQPGSQFPLTLRFAHAPPVTVQVVVRATAPAPPMTGMQMGR